MIFSENRYPLFRIMLQARIVVTPPYLDEQTSSVRRVTSEKCHETTFTAAERSDVLSSGADKGVLPHHGAELRWVFT
jgi:hypothetical protein